MSQHHFYPHLLAGGVEGDLCVILPRCAAPAAETSCHNITFIRICLQVALKVTCVSSFPDVPHLQLSYSIQGQQVAQNLMLPIVVSKFCTPPDNPVPKDVFFSRWRAIAGWTLCFARERCHHLVSC